MKKILILTIICSLFLFGCIQKESNYNYFCINDSNGIWVKEAEDCYDLLYKSDIQDQRWEMLKEYLEVVEFTGIEKNCGNEFSELIKRNMATEIDRKKYCTITYLTDNKYKKEYVELDCKKILETMSYSLISEKRERCIELKELTN